MAMNRAAEDPGVEFFSEMNPAWLMPRNPNRNPNAYIPSTALWVERLNRVGDPMEYDSSKHVGSPMWWGEQEGLDEEKKKYYEHVRDRWKDTMDRKGQQGFIRAVAMGALLAGGGAALGAASAAPAAASSGLTNAAIQGGLAGGVGGGTGLGTVGTAAAVSGGGGLAMQVPSYLSTGQATTASVPALSGGAVPTSGITSVGAKGGLTLSQGLKYANAAQQAYGAYEAAQEQKKLAKDAAKDKTRTQYHTPYYNEALAPLMQYFIQEAQKIYANRLQQYGLKPGDYSPYAALLSGIPLNYSGVGMPGSAQMNQTWR